MARKRRRNRGQFQKRLERNFVAGAQNEMYSLAFWFGGLVVLLFVMWLWNAFRNRGRG